VKQKDTETDNFTVAELVKYYNEFNTKHHKIEEELIQYDKSLPENIESLSPSEKNDLNAKLEEMNKSIKDLKKISK